MAVAHLALPGLLHSSFLGDPSSPPSAFSVSLPPPSPSLHFSVRKHAKRNTAIFARRLYALEEAMRIRREREKDAANLRKRPPLRRGKVSKRLSVPDHIPQPPYVGTDKLPELSRAPQIHDAEGIARMKAACELAARVLDHAGTLVRGYHGDTSKTFLCGNVNDQTKRLVKELIGARDVFPIVTSLELSNEPLRRNLTCNRLSLYSSEHAEKYGYGVVEDFVGHGVGTIFHSEPIIMHNRNNKSGHMVEGQTFTIEPILTMGTIESIAWDDGWTAVTADGWPAAQFEHTLLITGTGVEILTKH